MIWSSYHTYRAEQLILFSLCEIKIKTLYFQYILIVLFIQEFLELASTSSEDVMNCVLPFWPAVYNKLAVDTDHRVRELAHVALKAFVTVSEFLED